MRTPGISRKLAIAVLLLVLFVTAPASAKFVTNYVNVTPGGDLTGAVTKVQASFWIELIADGGKTFEELHTLKLSTDLDGPEWTTQILRNGNKYPVSRSNYKGVTFTGWDLSYESERNWMEIKVTLNGTAPNVSSDREIAVYRVTEVGTSTSVPGYDVNHSRRVLHNPNPPPPEAPVFVPANGTLSVGSIPSGAAVLINGTYRGTAPITRSLPEGMYAIALTLGDYAEYRSYIRVTAGQTAAFTAEMQRAGVLPVNGTTNQTADGILHVMSDPPGASVAVDGVVRGTTPLRLGAVDPGTHTVSASSAGYGNQATAVEVLRGEVSRVQFVLPATSPAPEPSRAVTPAPEEVRQETGSLIISSDPKGATIFIDEGKKGVTPLILEEISEGVHAVSISLDGYEAYSGAVTVRAGDAATVNARLVKKGFAITDIPGSALGLANRVLKAVRFP